MTKIIKTFKAATAYPMTNYFRYSRRLVLLQVLGIRCVKIVKRQSHVAAHMPVVFQAPHVSVAALIFLAWIYWIHKKSCHGGLRSHLIVALLSFVVCTAGTMLDSTLASTCAANGMQVWRARSDHLPYYMAKFLFIKYFCGSQ